jgi:hypothetical protein
LVRLAVALYLTWKLSWFAVFNLETVLQQKRHLTWRQLQEGIAGIRVFRTSSAASKVTAASDPRKNSRDYFSKFSAAISRYSVSWLSAVCKILKTWGNMGSAVSRFSTARPLSWATAPSSPRN